MGSRRVLIDLVSPAREKVRGRGHIPGDGNIDFHKAQPEGDHQGDQEPQNAGQETLDNGFHQKLGHHIAIGPAHGFQDADFSGPLRNVAGHRLESNQEWPR